MATEEQQARKPLDVTFINTEPSDVRNPAEAVALAMKECTVEHTKVLVYRDEAAEMWKVEFQIMYGYQGYQFVYLNDEGKRRLRACETIKFLTAFCDTAADLAALELYDELGDDASAVRDVLMAIDRIEKLEKGTKK